MRYYFKEFIAFVSKYQLYLNLIALGVLALLVHLISFILWFFISKYGICTIDNIGKGCLVGCTLILGFITPTIFLFSSFLIVFFIFVLIRTIQECYNDKDLNTNINNNYTNNQDIKNMGILDDASGNV